MQVREFREQPTVAGIVRAIVGELPTKLPTMAAPGFRSRLLVVPVVNVATPLPPSPFVGGPTSTLMEQIHREYLPWKDAPLQADPIFALMSARARNVNSWLTGDHPPHRIGDPPRSLDWCC